MAVQEYVPVVTGQVEVGKIQVIIQDPETNHGLAVALVMAINDASIVTGQVGCNF